MKLIRLWCRVRQRVLERWWYEGAWPCYFLWPFSLLYRLIVTVKAWCYRVGLCQSRHFGVPVVVVGNITVGGTGKTPFCIALCDYLKQQGFKPGLVSRGYGGQATAWPQRVTPLSDPLQVGDEPVLLVQRTGCPMVVAPDRVAAVEQLLAENDCDVVVSDDGLQHYRMGRAYEFVLIDKLRGLGNGWCLPAGPLREPKKRLQQVDCVVENGSAEMQIVAGQVTALCAPDSYLMPADTETKRVVAVAGIGHPQRFFNTLENLGFNFSTQIFPDHHVFTEADLMQLHADIIIMTEKDAVKCRAIADQRCFVLPISASVASLVFEGMCQRLNHLSQFRTQ